MIKVIKATVPFYFYWSERMEWTGYNLTVIRSNWINTWTVLNASLSPSPCWEMLTPTFMPRYSSSLIKLVLQTSENQLH